MTHQRLFSFAGLPQCFTNPCVVKEIGSSDTTIVSNFPRYRARPSNPTRVTARALLHLGRNGPKDRGFDWVAGNDLFV